MDISGLSDTQSESAVIGTLLNHPDYIEHTEFLQPNHFCDFNNSCLFWAIKELHNEGVENIDDYNLSTKLQSRNDLQRDLEKYNLPAMSKQIQLYNIVARESVEEYKMYAERVTSFAFKRDLIGSLEIIERDCFKPENTIDIINNMIYTKLDKLSQKYLTTADIQTLGSQIDEIWREIESRRSEDGSYGIPSKYKVFSDFFNFEPGELIVVQAKYKQGKSALLLNEVVHKLHKGIPCLVIDREMPTRLYTERLLANLSGISEHKIKSGKYSTEEDKLLYDKRQWLKTQPFIHIYDPDMPMERIYSLCRSLQNKMDLGFVVYDYLKSNEKTASETYLDLGAKCDYLKNQIAGKLNLPVLAACQLNRSGEVADSLKINQYASTAVKWGYKSQDMMIKDGPQCGNAYAKVIFNRLGASQPEDDDEAYFDFDFNGDTMTINEAVQHEVSDDY